jgi:selenocysteine lyase/cysteine desulfurase
VAPGAWRKTLDFIERRAKHFAMNTREQIAVDWKAVREQFPALRNRTYLNTATYGQLPVRSSQAAVEHFARRDRLACADFLSWFDELEPLRANIGRLIGASAGDIAFITNASQALGLVMGGIDWQEGDEILTLEHEFPNQLYAAQCIPGVRGVICHPAEIQESITDRTRLAVLSTVNYTSGVRPDLEPIIQHLHSRGALVYVDGTQSVGALRIDCAELQPDFLAVDAYKWLLSPNGAGFLYVRPEVRQWLKPNVIGWRSDKDWHSVESLHHGAPRFSDTAEKYEGGMLPFPSLFAMKESVQLLVDLGMDAIEARILELAAKLREELLALGGSAYPTLGDNLMESQILLMQLPEVDSSQLARHLQEREIHVSARREYLRVSPHFYNDESDMEMFVRAVKAYL